MKDASATTSTSTPAARAALLRELGAHLAGLHALMKKLAALADEKLAAMRRADTEALDGCTAREAELVQSAFADDAKRKAILARVAQSLHLPQPERARLSEIVARVPEPLASALAARNRALREIAAELQRKNRLAAKVAQNLQLHLRGLFAELAGAAQETRVYGPRGQHEGSRPRCWVEAVG